MKDIIIYTTDWCSACTIAKKALADKGYLYTEINIEKSGMSRKQLKEITGRMEVPSILIDGKSIGGLNDLLRII